MEPLFYEFLEKVKLSFSKVKGHITALEGQISKNSEELASLKISLSSSLAPIDLSLQSHEESPVEMKGFQASKQASKKAITKQASNQAVKTTIFTETILQTFSSIPPKCFLTFLTIYQLEEEQNCPVSYNDIALKMGLSESCIRAYSAFIIKRGLPVIRSRLNNKFTRLSISQEFRALGIKNRLISLFYQQDPSQRRISEGY